MDRRPLPSPSEWQVFSCLCQFGPSTLSELELYLGTDYVQSILDSTQVPVTLANAKFTKTKATVGKEFLLNKVDGVTYGIIGLVGKDFGETSWPRASSTNWRGSPSSSWPMSGWGARDCSTGPRSPKPGVTGRPYGETSRPQ